MAGEALLERADISLADLRPADQQAVRQLILAGLAERWGTLDPTRNPDLDNLWASYSGAIFVVAWQGDQIVGSGALIPEADGVGRVVRLSVAARARRQGVGRKVLEELCWRARRRGYRQLVLETTRTWQDAVAFFKDFGFRPAFELGGDVYFRLDL